MRLLSTLSIASVILLSSCGNDSKFDGFTRAKETGLHYKFYTHNDTAKRVEMGSGLYFSYKISTFPKDSLIVNSKDVSQDGSGYTRFLLQAVSFKGSFEDGFLMMHRGDSAAFIIPADSFFLKTMGMNALPPGINPGDHLKGVFSIKDVLTKAEIDKNQEQQKAEYEQKMKEASEKEKADLDKYLADNKITTAPTESGLIYIELKKGKGPSPKPTDVVTAHYHGTFLDGTVFDSSIERKKPVDFPLNQVIPGWTEGLGKMAKGGKAKLIVPSNIGYGPQGRPGGIPPFSTLVFEVELIDFKAAPEQQMPQPMPEGHGPNDGHNH